MRFSCDRDVVVKHVRNLSNKLAVGIGISVGIPDIPDLAAQLGQVYVDLEDPASLGRFLVTANIKLIRAEWLGNVRRAC